MTAVLLGCLLCLVVSPALAATMPAVTMKVVDADDGRPVAGVVALFRGSAREGTWTGHGGRGATLFVTEGVTNESGDLRLEKQEFSTQPFFLNTNLENPYMVLFKPGYVAVFLINQRRIMAEREDVTRWEHDKQTITIKRAATDAEVSQARETAAMYANLSIGACGWKKVPRFLVAVDRATFGDDRRQTATNPLQMILMNESYFVQQGCGSARAFFEPYLR